MRQFHVNLPRKCAYVAASTYITLHTCYAYYAEKVLKEYIYVLQLL